MVRAELHHNKGKHIKYDLKFFFVFNSFHLHLLIHPVYNVDGNMNKTF